MQEESLVLTRSHVTSCDTMQIVHGNDTKKRLIFVFPLFKYTPWRRCFRQRALQVRGEARWAAAPQLCVLGLVCACRHGNQRKDGSGCCCCRCCLNCAQGAKTKKDKKNVKVERFRGCEWGDSQGLMLTPIFFLFFFFFRSYCCGASHRATLSCVAPVQVGYFSVIWRIFCCYSSLSPLSLSLHIYIFNTLSIYFEAS